MNISKYWTKICITCLLLIVALLVIVIANREVYEKNPKQFCIDNYPIDEGTLDTCNYEVCSMFDLSAATLSNKIMPIVYCSTMNGVLIEFDIRLSNITSCQDIMIQRNLRLFCIIIS